MRWVTLMVTLVGSMSQASVFQNVAKSLQETCNKPTKDASCAKYCGSTATAVDVCSFTDLALARAAEVGAPAEVVAITNELASLLPDAKIERIDVTALKSGAVGVAAGVEALATDTALRLIQGLGKLILDRAQRESAAFVLAEIYKGLCQGDIKGWFVSTCGLADPGDGGVDLSVYSSGGPALQLLRSALDADLRAFPARSAGLLVKDVYLRDQTSAGAGNSVPESLVPAVETAVDDLESGIWFFEAVEPVALAIDAANDTKSQTPGPRTQWVACGLHFPKLMPRFQPFLSNLDTVENQTRATLLASLVFSEPCLRLIKDPKRVSPKLSAMLALDPLVRPRVEEARRALAHLAEATEALKNDSVDPVLQPDGGVDTGATERARLSKKMSASIRVSEAGFELSAVVVSSAQSICEVVKEPWNKVCKEVAQLSDVRTVLRRAGEVLEVARAIVEQDWMRALIKTSRLVIDGCATNAACLKEHPRLGPKFNSALALLSAKDADETAKVLDGLASPIGEWRGKQHGKRFTVSLTSHASVSLGAEWRWGQYGVSREKGDAYFQSPTLSLPIGVELAVGLGTVFTSFQLLFSLLDPAAFLQYDVAQDGRLPAPSLLTVLAPGAHARFALGPSPFGVGFFATARPGLRRWESALNAPGATVFQVGLELSVDVTLFTLMRNDP